VWKPWVQEGGTWRLVGLLVERSNRTSRFTDTTRGTVFPKNAKRRGKTLQTKTAIVAESRQERNPSCGKQKTLEKPKGRVGPQKIRSVTETNRPPRSTQKGTVLRGEKKKGINWGQVQRGHKKRAWVEDRRRIQKKNYVHWEKKKV